MTKQVDVEEDTVQSVRDRNNARSPFYKTLSFLSGGLLAMADEQD